MDLELSSVIDLTAMILCNMRNSPPSSPIPSPIPSPEPEQDSCDCMLCERGAPTILSKCHTWAWIMRVVFYSLKERYPEKKFFSLKNDVYEYMMNHWNTLGLDKKPSANWHKQIQDMLSHSRNIFESGMNHFRQNGFWRLKDLEDPWTSRPEAPRVTPPGSPKKRSSPKASPRNNNDSSDDDTTPPSPSKKLCIAVTIPSSAHVAVPVAGDPLDHEVAFLREQLAQVTESMAHLAQQDLAADYPQPAYHHNRVWEEAYPPYASVRA